MLERRNIVLLDEFDRETNAIINPEMCVKRIEDFPEVTVSCFSWIIFALTRII